MRMLVGSPPKVPSPVNGLGVVGDDGFVLVSPVRAESSGYARQRC
jgi:hypothetical protein